MIQVKHISSLLMLLLNLTFIFANVRAPYYRDGSFSGNVNSSEALSGIILTKEVMTIDIAPLSYKGLPREGAVQFDITYHIENRNSHPVQVPLAFIGLTIRNSRIVLNDETVDFTIEYDSGEREIFINMIADHRTRWNRKLYREFGRRLEFLSKEKGTPYEYDNNDGTTTQEDLRYDELVSDPNLDYLFYDEHGTQQDDRFGMLVFTATLAPGSNRLTIRYSQDLFYNEQGPGYGSPDFGSAVTGFDYLLYPALSWSLSESFTLSITITLPDIIKKGLFTRKIKAKTVSNCDLTEVYDKKKKIAIFHGVFSEFPADIFTFLIGAVQ